MRIGRELNECQSVQDATLACRSVQSFELRSAHQEPIESQSAREKRVLHAAVRKASRAHPEPIDYQTRDASAQRRRVQSSMARRNRSNVKARETLIVELWTRIR